MNVDETFSTAVPANATASAGHDPDRTTINGIAHGYRLMRNIGLARAGLLVSHGGHVTGCHPRLEIPPRGR